MVGESDSNPKQNREKNPKSARSAQFCHLLHVSSQTRGEGIINTSFVLAVVIDGEII